MVIFAKSTPRFISRLMTLPPIWGLAISAVLLVLIVFYLSVYLAPKLFPVNSVITITEGLTLTEIGDFLKEENVIHSPFLFKAFSVLFGGERKILAGDYFFNKKIGVGGIVSALASGEFGLEPIRVTILEGATVIDIGDTLASYINNFDEEKFVYLAKEKEGYLFPDTYFFLPNVKPRKVIDVMERTFEEKIKEIEGGINLLGRSLEDVIIMASLLEKEARQFETRQIIAGILWKRIDEDMPLQVDAVFSYINGKNTYELTLDDLDIDSPYNTYKYKGLPAGPIANPGLDAMRAAIIPIESKYYFYLADRFGTTYYSETFDEHKRKKQIYLN